MTQAVMNTPTHTHYEVVQPDNFQIAVIIARFQSDWLHSEHERLIRERLAAHPEVLVLLGNNLVGATERNPLSPMERKRMLQEVFPNELRLHVAVLNDIPGDNEAWSASVDSIIDQYLILGQSALVCGGSKDSCLAAYSGTHSKYVMESRDLSISATKVRRGIRGPIEGQSPARNFRRGQIAVFNNMHRTHPTTVDLAVFKDNYILLGRKAGNKKWQLIGGFTDGVTTYAEDAARELLEEASLVVDSNDLTQLGNFIVDDRRYRHEITSIITCLYVIDLKDSSVVAKAADDIEEVSWVLTDVFTDTYIEKNIHKNHTTMLKKALEWNANNRNHITTPTEGERCM